MNGSNTADAAVGVGDLDPDSGIVASKSQGQWAEAHSQMAEPEQTILPQVVVIIRYGIASSTQAQTPTQATSPHDSNDSNDSLDELFQPLVQRQKILQQQILKLEEALRPHTQLHHHECPKGASTVAELVAAARLAALVERSFASAYAVISESARASATAAEHALAAQNARVVERDHAADSPDDIEGTFESTATAIQQ